MGVGRSVDRGNCIMKKLAAFLIFIPFAAFPQSLPLPERSQTALTGSQLLTPMSSLTREAREDRIRQEVMDGNIPEYLRSFVKVTYSATAGGSSRSVSVWVAPDYLA